MISSANADYVPNLSRLAQQDYDIWSIAYPYASAGDAMQLYFHSNNVPTPNRMNWKDPETDRLIEEGSAALNDEKRFEAFAKVQKIVTDNADPYPKRRRCMSAVNAYNDSGSVAVPGPPAVTT